MDIIQGLVQAGSTAGRPALRIVSNNRTFDVINSVTSNVIFSILNDGSVGAGSTIYTNLITNYADSSSGGSVSTGGTGSAGVSSQWTTVGTKIYYNLGNIGIGTLDPIAPLHIYNNTITAILPTEIVVAGATSATISGTTDRYISFPYTSDSSGLTGQTQYTFTTTEALECDILVVGGGGAGGQWMGGGGGAGGIVYAINQTLSAATYRVRVGKGGVGINSSTDPSQLGINQDGVESSLMNSDASSYITLTLGGVSQQLRGLGGGGGGTFNTPATINGRGGGSGGGCSETYNNGWVINTAGTATQPATYWNGTAYVIGGKAGRQNTNTAQDYGAGGGGGLGGQATDYRNGNDGVAITITGTSQFYAAGGGVGQYYESGTLPSTSAGLGGSSIGGNGRIFNSVSNSYFAAPRNQATSGADGTGSGGGGGAFSQTPYSLAGSGGSGIVIIRYRRQTQPSVSNARLLLDATTTGTASIEFRRGVGADAQNDFRIINDSNSSLKLQCENTTQSYTDSTANIAWFSSNETIIHKNTTMNGRVGVGTVYHATRTLDVVGDANVSGVMSVGSLSASNVTITNSSSSNVSLTIQNGFASAGSLPQELYTTNPAGVTSGTIGTSDRFYIFTHTAGFDTNTPYTNVPIPEGITFDLFMIGGGGAGGGIGGAGGGSGACLVAFNQTITAGNYTFVVGGAGSINGTGSGRYGYDTYIGNNIYKARGGGGGAEDDKNGLIGGCSGGSAGGPVSTHTSPAPATDNYFNGTASGPVVNNMLQYGIYGNKGGNTTTATYCYTGGGGIGVAAANASGSMSAPGGNGLYQVVINSTTYNFRTYFTNNGTFGVQDGTTGNYYIGGGGGGGGWNGIGGSASINISGGLGGGGIGKFAGSPANGEAGQPNTGSGGGGGSTGFNGNSYGGNGGSGLLIFRYRNTVFPSSSATINLLRGTVTDANHDYRVGNYNGEFKIISSVSNTDTDYIKISTSGAITNPTGTASWNTGSDRRIKENIERASYDKCFENINKLELNRFNYVSGFNTVNRDRTQLGFIAQEVNDIFPKAISSQEYYTNELCIPDLLSIDITQINYSLYGAVKKLIKINKDQETKFDIFDRRLKTIETALNIVTEPITSNIIVEPITSNITVETVEPITSNIIVDHVEPITSNIIIDHVEPITSNLATE